MKSMLKVELSKAFRNKLFIISVVISCALSIAVGAVAIYFYNRNLANIETANAINNAIENPWLPVNTLYNFWIADQSGSDIPYLYYFLMPLLATFAYGWSYCSEVESGYVKNILHRTTRRNYFLSKYIAVFLSGAMTIALSLFANLVLISSFIPAIKPDFYYNVNYNHRSGTMFSYLFFTYPILYIIAMVIMTSVFAGIFACLSLALTFYFKNRVAGLVIPFIVLIAFNYSTDIIGSIVNNVELSPLKFLHCTPGNMHLLWVAVVEIIILISITLLITLRRGKRNDIF